MLIEKCAGVVERAFRGQITVVKKVLGGFNETPQAGEIPFDVYASEAGAKKSQSSVQVIPFYHLTLDLPPMPLFMDEFERNVIPQVAMETLLEKFNGVQEKVLVFLMWLGDFN